jgi:chemotaxis-related protein WspD
MTSSDHTGTATPRRERAAGHSFLDRPIPPGRMQEDARLLAEPLPARAGERHSLFVFSLGVEHFGLPGGVLDEVVSDKTVHSLPHQRSEYVKGVVNIRGRLVVCVSLGTLLNVGAGALTVRSTGGRQIPRIVVIRHNGFSVAFPVSRAYGLEPFDPAGLLPLPATLEVIGRHFSQGMIEWHGRTVGCLDPELVFHALERGLA